MIQNFEIPAGSSAFETLVAQLTVIMTAGCRLEIQSIDSGQSADLTVFPFGRENQAVALPIQAARYDWEILAIIQRFVCQGRTNSDGAKILRSDAITADRATTVYSNFAYNGELGSAIPRSSFVASFVGTYAALAQDQQQTETSKNPVDHTRILMKDCLEKVSLNLGSIVRSRDSSRRYPAVRSDTLKELQSMIELCGSKETFLTSNFIDLSVRFARDHEKAFSE